MECSIAGIHHAEPTKSSKPIRRGLSPLGAPLFGLFVAVVACLPVQAQTVVATIPAGTYPSAVAVNTNSNMVYVADEATNDLTVVDGATNTPTTLTTGPGPNAIAVNLITNTIYVVNIGVASGPEVVTPGNILVINGATNATSTIPLPLLGRSIVVNPVTNLIYVGTSDNSNNNNLMVIDGATTHTVATIPLPQDPPGYGDQHQDKHDLCRPKQYWKRL
jgi:DNA-binding beta-propeller fold protein YncE